MGSLTKQTEELLSPKTLKDRFGGLYVMKNFIGNDETDNALEQSFKATTKLKHELSTEIEKKTVPLMERSFLAEDMLKNGKH